MNHKVNLKNFLFEIKIIRLLCIFAVTGFNKNVLYGQKHFHRQIKKTKLVIPAKVGIHKKTNYYYHKWKIDKILKIWFSNGHKHLLWQIKKPGQKDLEKELKNTYKLWNEVINYVFKKYPEAKEEWNFSSFGWSCRIRVQKRWLFI